MGSLRSQHLNFILSEATAGILGQKYTFCSGLNLTLLLTYKAFLY